MTPSHPLRLTGLLALLPFCVPFCNSSVAVCRKVTPSPGSAAPGTGKRYPTIPTVSQISFDFLHYIRPPPESAPAPKAAFEQLLVVLNNTTWDCGGEMLRTAKEGLLRVNLLRNLCHVLYFDCQQVRTAGVGTAGRRDLSFERLPC